MGGNEREVCPGTRPLLDWDEALSLGGTKEIEVGGRGHGSASSEWMDARIWSGRMSTGR